MTKQSVIDARDAEIDADIKRVRNAWEYDGIYRANSYELARALVDAYDGLCDEGIEDDWYLLAGDCITGCDNLHDYLDFFRKTVGDAPRGFRCLMMNSTERHALASLPRRVKVYRGCYGFNEDGMSWSLSREVAGDFIARYQRYVHKDVAPVILTGRVERSKCVLKLDRGEQEIISSHVKIVKREFPCVRDNGDWRVWSR